MSRRTQVLAVAFGLGAFAVACSQNNNTPSPSGGKAGATASQGGTAGTQTGTGGAQGGSSNAGSGATSGGTSGGANTAGTAGSSDGGATSMANTPWDWSGVVGTGQSLSVGAEGNPAITTTQPFSNLKLALGSLTGFPLDASSDQLSMVPLVEPIRPYASGYPGPYPGNTYGETPHTAMADQITSLFQAAFGGDYITAHTMVGESGQGMSVIKKGATDTGDTGHAYAATLFEVEAIARLAQAAGKTYGVGAIIITHGESDTGDPGYGGALHQLWSDYNADLAALTGQSESIPMLVSQQHSVPNNEGSTSPATLGQWKAGVDYPGDIICSGPKYQYDYAADHVHLSAVEYQKLGEKYGEVYFEKVVLGNDWQPLQPTSIDHAGAVLTVHFHVPVPPLAWDEAMPSPFQSALMEWKNGKGFEVQNSGGRVTIDSVEIDGDSVKITCASDPGASGVVVRYAMSADSAARAGIGTVRWGQLKDSDPFVGSTTSFAQPNYCVAFEMAVP